MAAGQGAQDEAAPLRATEALTAWEWFQHVRLPEEPGPGRYLDFLLTPAVFDKARADMQDLRLYDAKGEEVPFQVRVRRAVDERQPLEGRQFNESKSADRSIEVSLDLGEARMEHNQIDLVTGGTDFRRRVRLEGSDTGNDWNTIVDKEYVVKFQAGGQLVDVHQLNYPASRFRYLRVRVYPDSSQEADAPAFNSVVVYRSVQVPGEYVTADAQLGPREPVPVSRAPGSAWTITFGGQAVFCEGLSFDIAEQDFVRGYQVEGGDTPERGQSMMPGEWPDEKGRPQSIQEPARGMVIAAGEWRRRAGKEIKPLEVRFPEVLTRGLRLLVIDYRNPPLTVTGVKYKAAARQVVLARSEKHPRPLRLFFGNPTAPVTNYDFARNLPDKLTPPPARGELTGPVEKNPEYRPAPKPLAERWPWLIYLVLGFASLVLLVILALLARKAVVRHDQEMAKV
jgi:hypothetical protein